MGVFELEDKLREVGAKSLFKERKINSKVDISSFFKEEMNYFCFSKIIFKASIRKDKQIYI